MPTKLIPYALTAIGGLLLGWLLWGRSPSPATIQRAANEAKAAQYSADSGAIALLTPAANAARQIDTVYRAAKHAKAARDTPAQLAQRADSALQRGDTATGLPLLRSAYAACQRGADSLESAVQRCVTVADSLRAAVDS